MYFNKISNKITVSRAVMGTKVLKTVRLYKTSPSSLSAFDGTCVYDITNNSYTLTNGWLITPYSNSLDTMYFTEAQFEYDTTDSTYTVPADSFTKPQRYADRFISITLDTTPIRNDRYAESARQTLNVRISSEGYIGDPTITVVGNYGTKESPNYVSESITGRAISLRYKNAPRYLLVSVWYGEVCIRTNSFDVVDRTGNINYAGSFDNVTSLFNAIENKDGGLNVAIYTGEDNSNNFTGKILKSGYSVYFNGNEYVVVDKVDSVTANIALSVVSQATADGPILGPVSWFNSLVADTVSANEGLFATIRAGLVTTSDLATATSGLASKSEIPSVPDSATINSWVTAESNASMKAISARVGTVEAYTITFPANGYIKSENNNVIIKGDGTAILNDATIKGDVTATSGIFKNVAVESGNFKCTTFSSMPSSSNSATYSISSHWNTSSFINWIRDTVRPNVTFGALYKASLLRDGSTNTNVAYARFIYSDSDYLESRLCFYSSDFKPMAWFDYSSYSSSCERHTSDEYLNTFYNLGNITVSIYKTNGDIFKLLNIPVVDGDTSSLEKDQVYMTPSGQLYIKR